MWGAVPDGRLSQESPPIKEGRIQTYDRLRPHPALEMAAPAGPFHPSPQPEPVKAVPLGRPRPCPP